jgi:hypothetical protein
MEQETMPAKRCRASRRRRKTPFLANMSLGKPKDNDDKNDAKRRDA